MEKHKPLMSSEEIQKRILWQEEVYCKLKEVNKQEEIEILNKKIIILPGVFAPIFGDSEVLAKSVLEETKEEDKVLDLGTGSGIQGLFASQKAREVVSADINPQALNCAKINADKNKITKISFVQSDLFSNIKERFSLIIFNPPFRWFKPRDMLERGELDENYTTLKKFFKEVRKHLLPKGRILLVFSDSGDIKYLENLIEKSRMCFKILNKEKQKTGWTHLVYKITL